jgi:hypothetical protein
MLRAESNVFLFPYSLFSQLMSDLVYGIENISLVMNTTVFESPWSTNIEIGST